MAYSTKDAAELRTLGLILNGKAESFNQIAAYVNQIFKIQFDTTCYLNGTCTCYESGISYICKHILAISIRMKLVEAPSYAKDVPLGQKKKKGRTKKAKAALITM